MGKRLFPDLRLILLRYAVIHIEGDDGRAGNLQDVLVHNSSVENLGRLPGAGVVILPVLSVLKTYANHTIIIPPTNFLL